MTGRHTFRKTERLSSQKVIETLFAGGNKSFSAYPIRVVLMPLDGRQPERVQVLISVSKRRFKHAVDRNRVKRQIREAYRLDKQLLIDSLPGQQSLALAFIWLSDEHFPTEVVGEKVRKLLLRTAESLNVKVLYPKEDNVY